MHQLSEIIQGSKIWNVRPAPARQKVLFVIDTLETGGAEYSLLQTVIRFRYIVPVVCHLYAGETLKQQFIDQNIKVYSIDIFEKYKFYKAFKNVSKIVKKEQPDLLVAYLTRSELVSRMVGKRFNIPVIGTLISDLYGKAYNNNLPFRSKQFVKLFRFVNQATTGLCKGFIANSDFVKDRSIKTLKLPQHKIITIHRGRDKSKFKFQLRERNATQKIRFISIGRLVPVKDHETQIKAFKSFLELYPESTLHIAGEGPERNRLSQLISETGLSGKVLLLGNQNDLPALMEEYDCFISSSLSEGFSGAVVEAFFSGLPVIASDIPSNREIVNHLESGYLFESGSIESLTDAMKWVMKNPQVVKQFSQNAFVVARERFDLEQTAIRTEEYLLKMIS